ncbi:MAG: prolipoprotein diacylglyceryl transferase [Candidatus Gracilibacteria bacterium]|nr:prolipoprotein diacylglyceryl transferase [Candidatus Gracilibacteria bacterium]
MPIFEINIYGIHLAPTYYGLMYTIAFIIGYIVLKKRKIFTSEELENLIFYVFLGVIIGGRLGYVVIYDLSYYIKNPVEILQIWKGGMSFFGGTIGVIISMIVFSKRFKLNFFSIADQITSLVPIGLFLGRIGNYINKELLGYEYHGFLAVEKNGKSYFPNPLLEAFLEGILLFIILNYIHRNKKFDGQVGVYFLIFYGIFRFIAEYSRFPEPGTYPILYYFTIGQVFSLIIIFFGLFMLLAKKLKKDY